MVIAAAGALSVAAAASATAATWGQGAQARADGSAEITQETDTHGEIAHGTGMRQVAAPEAMTREAVVAPRLTAVQDAIAQRKAAAKAAAARAAQKQAARAQATAQGPTGTTSTLAASGPPQQIAQAMLGSFGWSSSQFSCLDPLWAHESGWSVSAYNAGSGAFGIPQALPGSRMASAGPDWQTNAATQIKWGLDYIKGTYGSPCGAWSHEEATGWY